MSDTGDRPDQGVGGMHSTGEGFDRGPVGEPPGHDERQWALVAHLAALAGFIVPFGNVIGPLVIWLIKKEEMPFVNDQGKEALNFQITMLLAFLVAGVLALLLVGFALMLVLLVVEIVMPILAGVRANEGKRYRYPFTLRLIQ